MALRGGHENDLGQGPGLLDEFKQRQPALADALPSQQNDIEVEILYDALCLGFIIRFEDHSTLEVQSLRDVSTKSLVRLDNQNLDSHLFEQANAPRIIRSQHFGPVSRLSKQRAASPQLK